MCLPGKGRRRILGLEDLSISDSAASYGNIPDWIDPREEENSSKVLNEIEISRLLTKNHLKTKTKEKKEGDELSLRG